MNFINKFKIIISNSYVENLQIILNKFRKEYNTTISYPASDDTQKLIYELLDSEKPCMIGRFGSVEINALTKCIARSLPFTSAIKKYLNNQCNIFLYEKKDFYELKNNAGVFDANKKTINAFTKEYISAIPQLDILGSWCDSEKYLEPYFNSNLIKVKLGDLEPYKFSNPWSKILKNKKVLVVHPFSKTIEKQYNRNHSKLFKNKDILPNFKLITLKAVQTAAGESCKYNNWIDALNSMKDDISKIDFDIAIIGCGAYGLPLAAYVKSLGKKAVHLGGATQILFGIRGKRWDEREDFAKMFNEYWCYPSESEKPKNSDKVENSCYW